MHAKPGSDGTSPASGAAATPAIGRRLLEERQRLGITPADLGSRAGLDAAGISSFETGRSTPTVGELYRLANALGVPVDDLMAQARAEGEAAAGDRAAPEGPLADAVVRRGQRAAVDLGGGVRWELIRPAAESATDGVEQLEITYPPGAESAREPTGHEGREYGLVLDGLLEVEVEGERVTLQAGDSVAFDSRRPHRIANPRPEPARALWTIVRGGTPVEARGTLRRLRGRVGRRRGGAVTPILLATIALFAASPLLAAGSLGSDALLSMLPFAAVLAIAAVGQTLVVQQAGLDLSVAGMMSLAAVLVTKGPNLDDGKLLGAIALVLVVALAVGAVNGLAVSLLGVSPFVATLAMGWLLLGVVQAVSGGSPTGATENLNQFALDKTLGIPNTVLVAVAVVALVGAVVKRTVAGRRFEASGASPAAARAAGVPVLRYVVGTYMIASACSAVAGMLLAGYVKTPGIFVGETYLLPTVAAVVLGGTALTGGAGSVVATAVGALFLTQVNQLVLAMGADTAAQFVIQGAIIALGMLLRVVPWARLGTRRSRAAPPARAGTGGVASAGLPSRVAV